MKPSKTPKIDPIVAKYNKKVGFLRKININLVNLKNYIKRSYKENDDVKEFSQMIFNIILYGVIGNLAVSIIGIQISPLNIIGIGCIAWIIESKLVGILKEILSSINFVKVYK